MPRPVPVPVRLVIRKRWRDGQSALQIAHDLELPARTVRFLIARFRSGDDASAGTAYRTGPATRSPRSQAVHDATIDLRRDHPKWGAELLRIQLRRMGHAVPSARTLQRWLRRAGLSQTPTGRPSRGGYVRSTVPHEVWQMDACEHLALTHGEASWLRLTDECSGAVLQTRGFPPRGVGLEFAAEEVQEALRQAFADWGLPARIRVDNGTPWGATGGLPTALALWLIGLGVGLIWNPPRTPRRNGVVERSQDVGQDWAEPAACSTVTQLQDRLNEFDRIQREEYPAIGGRSRRAAYPKLSHSGRGYRRPRETKQWDLARVLNWLSESVVARRVNVNGKVSVYDRCHWVGRIHVGRSVWVTLDPEAIEWVIMSEGGGVLKRAAATELTAERICRLSVSRERGPGTRGKT